MTENATKSSALPTALAFHYQTLIGLKQCYAMREDDALWFERDGDVSFVGKSQGNSTQTEVKHYDPNSSLTDNHENFWNTLKNWLAPDFQQNAYSSLVLHTTQPFGATSLLSDWNKKTASERLKTIETIYAKRTPEELAANPRKSIVQTQMLVMNSERQLLNSVLEKIYIFTDADCEDELRADITETRLKDIPKPNRKKYLEALIGFVYECADHKRGWKITGAAFEEKCQELTSIYSRKQFTFPTFSFEGKKADESEVVAHEEKLFVKKIQHIEYHDAIPEAIGNWIELHNALNEELDGAPQFRNLTNKYQKDLITRFGKLHAITKRNCKDSLKDSQQLYDQFTYEPPTAIDSLIHPPLAYKNGLIHDAMDDEHEKITWKVEP